MNDKCETTELLDFTLNNIIDEKGTCLNIRQVLHTLLTFLIEKIKSEKSAKSQTILSKCLVSYKEGFQSKFLELATEVQDSTQSVNLGFANLF